MRLKNKTDFSTLPIYAKSRDWLIVPSSSLEDYPRCVRFHPETHWIEADYEVVPLAFVDAKAFVDTYHRHNTAPQGHKFSIGLKVAGELIDVVITSIPKVRHRNDGKTLEINRCCAMPGYYNACSKIYSLADKAGRSMGYTRFITYTLMEENGSNLKAAGFQLCALHRLHRMAGTPHPATGICRIATRRAEENMDALYINPGLKTLQSA